MKAMDEQLTNLVEELKTTGVLRSPEIIKAFLDVDRKDFVRKEDVNSAYENIPFSIGFGQTISQPLTVAFMLELLEPKRGERVLDVGAGSGWSTALLAYLTGKEGYVFGTEIVPELLEFGKKNLSKYFKENRADIFLAKRELGLPEEAPFDRILVSASGEKISKTLVEQLKPDGTLVMPVENSIIKVVRGRFSDELVEEEYPGFVFVKLKE